MADCTYVVGSKNAVGKNDGSNDKPGVLCIQPPIYDFALYDLYLQPYGLRRLEAWFRSGGWRVTEINALDWRDPVSTRQMGMPKRKSDGTGKFFRQAVPLPDGIERIPRTYARYGILSDVFEEALRRAAVHTDVVCITTGMTYWYQGVVETVRLVRRHIPHAVLLVGGVYTSLLPEDAGFRTGADCTAVGDGEPVLRSFLGERGFPVPEGPIPAFPDIPPSSRSAAVPEAAVIRLNSGCPFRCDYCGSRVITPRFSPGDPEAAFDAVTRLHHERGITRFAFYDDALLVNRHQVFIPFLERVAESGLPLSFSTPNAVHIRFLDRDTAVLMKRAGFREVRMGYESSSEDFHAHYDGKFSEDEFRRALKHLRSAGFTREQLPVYVLSGLPGQRAEEVEGSVREAAAAGAAVSIAEFSPVPGTPLWDEAVRFSRYPIEQEPLYHNNIFFPTEWEGQTRADLARLKELARLTRLQQNG